MRDSTDIGGLNNRIRFQVSPETSPLALLGSGGGSEPDVTITRERDAVGGTGVDTEPASLGVSVINAERTEYEDPDVPEVVIVVEPGGGGGGTSVDPYLVVDGGGFLIENGILQLAMQGGGFAQLQPGAGGFSLELIGEDMSGNTGLFGLDVGPVNALSVAAGQVNASSMTTSTLGASTINAGDLNATNLTADNFDISSLEAGTGRLNDLSMSAGGAITFEGGEGLAPSMLYGDQSSGRAVLRSRGLMMENETGDVVTMELINDSFDQTGQSLSLSRNLQVKGELGITELLTGDQIFFQVMPRFFALGGSDDDEDDEDEDGDVVVKRRAPDGTTTTAKVRSSGTVYEDPDVPEVVIVVEPGGGGGSTSIDPFLKVDGGDLRLMDEGALQFGADGRIDISPNLNNQLVMTGGDLLMNGGSVDVGSGGLFGAYMNIASADLGQLNADVFSARQMDVVEGGALTLGGANGPSYLGTDSNGVLNMQSLGGFSMINANGDSVGMQVLSEGSPTHGFTSGSLYLNSRVTSTGVSINSGVGEQANMIVGTDGRLALDKGMSIGDDLSVQGQLYSGQGSFLSSDPVSGIGGYVGVLEGRYTGGDLSDRPAVQGVNTTNSGFGVGGSFSGGWKGVDAHANSSGSFSRYGVRASASGGNTNYGVRTEATGSGYGIYAKGNSNAMAGSFIGNVDVTGSLSKGGGSFKIDHPLDPENKYLFHSFVESPDMMNVYNGNAVFDASGEVEVELPDWFESLNREFRYQLTCVGGFAPVYVSEEIEGNRFTIAGGAEGLKVSWQVTGIRHDPWAEANRIPTEVDKAPEDRGHYLHPEARGLPTERSLYHQRDLREEREREAAPSVRTQAVERTPGN